MENNIEENNITNINNTEESTYTSIFNTEEQMIFNGLWSANHEMVEDILREYFECAQDQDQFIVSLKKVLDFYNPPSLFTILERSVIDKGYVAYRNFKREVGIGLFRPNFTPQQLTLILYFTLKASNIDITSATNINQSSIVKFLHIISGYTSTNSKNSKFYQLVRKAPKFDDRSIKALLSDLHIIKPYFESEEFADAIKLIDALIQDAGN